MSGSEYYKITDRQWFWARAAFFILSGLLILSLVMNFASKFDRAELHETDEKSEETLAARARINVVLVKMELGKITPKDMETLRANWEPAGFHKVEPFEELTK